MEALVVYFSNFGNTRKIAEAITETLQGACGVRVIPAGQITSSDFREAGLVLMGTPTHNMNLPKAVQPFFKDLPRGVLKGVPVAAFDTSYKMSWWLAHFTAANRLLRKLRKLGGKKIAPPETFHVAGREGPLFAGELERAREWAGMLLARAGWQAQSISTGKMPV